MFCYQVIGHLVNCSSQNILLLPFWIVNSTSHSFFAQKVHHFDERKMEKFSCWNGHIEKFGQLYTKFIIKDNTSLLRSQIFPAAYHCVWVTYLSHRPFGVPLIRLLCVYICRKLASVVTVSPSVTSGRGRGSLRPLPGQHFV